MARFTLSFWCDGKGYWEVEADSLQEAKEMFIDGDGDEFLYTMNYDYDIDEVEVAEEVKKVKEVK